MRIKVTTSQIVVWESDRARKLQELLPTLRGQWQAINVLAKQLGIGFSWSSRDVLHDVCYRRGALPVCCGVDVDGCMVIRWVKLSRYEADDLLAHGTWLDTGMTFDPRPCWRWCWLELFGGFYWGWGASPRRLRSWLSRAAHERMAALDRAQPVVE